jgi:hypothetical protein
MMMLTSQLSCMFALISKLATEKFISTKVFGLTKLTNGHKPAKFLEGFCICVPQRRAHVIKY